MSELTKRQANLVKRQITKLYGRNYIPLITTDSTLSIGDVLISADDITPIIDSSVFDSSLIKIVEGNKVNKNIVSGSDVNISTKLKGEVVLTEHFKIDDAGLAVDFKSRNQMILKVLGIRQQSLKDFVAFRSAILEKYTKGEISSKVYIVRGLVYADKYFLQYSGNNGGSIGFNLNADANLLDIEASADFSLKWKKDVGYHIDGLNGGVLAYRVSGVRLKRHLIPETVQNRIMNGMSESDALSLMSFDDRKALADKDAFEVVDLTDEILVSFDNETV
jgi:hypothetical protein